MADDTQRSACGGGATENDATQTISADCFIQTIRLYPNNFLIAKSKLFEHIHD